mgnify:CR=1 FL=1
MGGGKEGKAKEKGREGTLAKVARRSWGNNFQLSSLPSPTMAFADDDSRDFISAIKDGNAEVVQAMLEQGGIELDQTDEDHQTPIFIATIEGHQKIVQLLIDAGALINQADNDGVFSKLSVY